MAPVIACSTCTCIFSLQFLHDLVDDLAGQDARLGIQQVAVRQQRLDQLEVRLDLFQQLRLLHAVRRMPRRRTSSFCITSFD
jgi:hypothetical protein